MAIKNVANTRRKAHELKEAAYMLKAGKLPEEVWVDLDVTARTIEKVAKECKIALPAGWQKNISCGDDGVRSAFLPPDVFVRRDAADEALQRLARLDPAWAIAARLGGTTWAASGGNA